MRTVLLLSLVVCTSLASADTPVPSSPFDPIARVARARRMAEPFSATFEPKSCEIRIATGRHLSVPLRTVTWSMTTERDDGVDVIVVTARCPAKVDCIAGTATSHTTGIPHKTSRTYFKLPRFAFQFAAPARDARKLFTELKGFTTHCATPAP